MDTPVVEPGHPFWEFAAAVCTWCPGGMVPGSASRVVDAASHLLDTGSWSPALHQVAALPRSVPDGELAELLLGVLPELGLARLDPLPRALGAAGLLAGAHAAALPLERLGLGLERVVDAPSEPPFTAFTLDIDERPVNRGSAYGCGPRTTLSSLLDADPGTVLLQVDDCCCPGCLDREVRVTRVGTLVCWEWLGRRNVLSDDGEPRGIIRCDVFDAGQHDAEIRRLLAAPELQPGATSS